MATGYDFTKEEDRRRAEEYIDQYKPMLVIGSPMCRMFSQLQRLRPWNEEERRWREDRKHLKFMAQIYF